MGFEIPVAKIFDFVYKTTFDNGLTEYEFDHVFAGEYEGIFSPDPREIAAVEYRELDRIKSELHSVPENFTSWFRIAFPKIELWWEERYGKGSEADSW